MLSQATVTIGERFRGPPRSGNGGYVGGEFASLLGLRPDQAAEVTLRSPVPLDTPMSVHPASTGVDIRVGDTLIAEARSGALALEVPKPPSWDQALAARPNALSLQLREGSPVPGGRGFHPICFCCGADHEEGLQVFAASVDDTSVAAAWETRSAWADSTGNLPLSYLWTALDCPGQIAYAAQGIRTGLLGRITATIERPAPAGDKYIVTAWPLQVDGKKHLAGSAIFTTTGELIARALSVWIGRRN